MRSSESRRGKTDILQKENVWSATMLKERIGCAINTSECWYVQEATEKVVPAAPKPVNTVMQAHPRVSEPK